MSTEGPYRADSGFAEKHDIAILSEEVSGLKKAWVREVGRMNFIWIVVGLVSCLLWIAYYVNTDTRLLRHEEAIERVRMGQPSYRVEQAECRHRQSYLLDKQQEASSCASLCLMYLNTIWPETSEAAEQSYNNCRVCLISVRRPMPFEVAHPEYGHIRRH